MTTTLARLPLVDPATATGPSADLLSAVNDSLGMVPNFMRALASSPNALQGFLGLNTALHSGGALDHKIAERVALVVAEGNGCQYCVSAHTALASQAGLDAEEILAARQGKSAEAKAGAAVTFAASVVEHRGDVTTAELEALRDVGYGDDEIVELIAHIGLNTFTNLIGKIGAIDIDFPQVELLGASA